MLPIARNEVLGIAAYEEIRPHFRSRVIQLKKSRRVALGNIMTAIFENRDSVLLQIQEMVRTERLTQESAIAHEIETYNDLIPGPNQLSLTLTIEIAEKEVRESMLEKLAGLEEKLALVFDGHVSQGQAKDRSVEGIARTTAVHYFKFDLSAEAVAALARPTVEAKLVCHHPAYPVEVVFNPAVVAQLREDLAAPGS